jgi:hypothetical protein
MSDHGDLFDHFGAERAFTATEGMGCLGLDPDNTDAWNKIWFRARKNTRRDTGGHYLVSLQPDDERVIFTRDRELLKAQLQHELDARAELDELNMISEHLG